MRYDLKQLEALLCAGHGFDSRPVFQTTDELSDGRSWVVRLGSNLGSNLESNFDRLARVSCGGGGGDENICEDMYCDELNGTGDVIEMWHDGDIRGEPDQRK